MEGNMPRVSSAITQEDAQFVEEWESISNRQVYIIRLDPRGDEQQELITGHRQFFVTTEERLLTQNRFIDKTHDPFVNGAFRPVRVPDTVSIETNPNALSDDEIASILVSSPVAWEEWMKVIDSPQTFERMMEAAEHADVSLSRFRELEERYRAVKPKRRITQKDQEQYEKMGGDGGSRARRASTRTGG